jgi:hypothetical protein
VITDEAGTPVHPVLGRSHPSDRLKAGGGKDGRSSANPLGGRGGGRAVMGGPGIRARAAARRAPQGAKAELPVLSH